MNRGRGCHTSNGLKYTVVIVLNTCYNTAIHFFSAGLTACTKLQRGSCNKTTEGLYTVLTGYINASVTSEAQLASAEDKRLADAWNRHQSTLIK
jgi:hypothetical protein